jgi:hypothetical protein
MDGSACMHFYCDQEQPSTIRDVKLSLSTVSVSVWIDMEIQIQIQITLRKAKVKAANCIIRTHNGSIHSIIASSARALFLELSTEL